MHKNLRYLFISALPFLVTACSTAVNDNSAPRQTAAHTESPVTLQAYNTIFGDELWTRLVVEPVKKKFPNVTLEKVSGTLDQILSSGNVPDLIFAPLVNTQNLKDADYPLDLTDLVKTNNTDLSRSEDVVIDSMKKYSDQKLYGLPLYENLAVLVYNKDIFDKFSVAYPQDHMTYEEVSDLARKLTRTDGGVQYGGYTPFHWFNMTNQLSLSFIDKKTNRADLQALETIFPLHKAVYDIPGIPKLTYKNFVQDKTLAMVTPYLSALTNDAAALKEMNWGMVTLPEFKSRPGYAAEVDFHAVYVSKVSTHPDEAFQVASYLSLDDGVQSLYSRNGKLSHLKNQGDRGQFGADIGMQRDDVIHTITNTKPAPLRDVHPLDRRTDIVTQPITAEYNAYISGAKDLNTALRDAEDAVNKKIEAEMHK